MLCNLHLTHQHLAVICYIIKLLTSSLISLINLHKVLCIDYLWLTVGVLSAEFEAVNFGICKRNSHRVS